MHHTRQPRFLRAILRALPWFAAALAIALAFSAVVPLQDDELMHYRLLRCMSPGTWISPQDDCTGFWDLNFFGTGLLLPLRVFWYSGVPPAFFYAPFYALWPAYESARLLGALFLAAQAWCLARLFRWPQWIAFAALLALFPYAFQHLADTGPVAYTATSVFALALVFRRWIATRHVGWALLTSAVVALGVWTKLVYLWLLPGLFGLWALEFWSARRSLKPHDRLELVRQGLAAVAGAGLLLLPYFLSTDPYQAGRLVVLEQLTGAKGYSLSGMAANFFSLPAMHLLLHPLSAAHRLYHVAHAGAASALFSLLLYVVPPAVAAAFALLAPRGPERTAAARSFVCFALFGATVLCIARSVETWAMHHAILAYPFLILGVCELWPAVRNRSGALRVAGAWAGLFLAVNVAFWLAFPLQAVRSEADWSRHEVHAVLDHPALSSKYIYVTLDLGMYFYQTTLGPADQHSIFRQPLNKQWQVDQLRDFKRRTGRSLLFLYDTEAQMSDMLLVGRSFTLKRCAAVRRDAVWRILYEPNGDPDNPCEH